MSLPGLIFSFVLLSACALARGADLVLVVSIDALHPAALSERSSPTLRALMRAGRFTLEGRSVDPPQTLIAHTAMLTGLPPERSGKRDNGWKPGAATVDRPTLFDDAKQAGLRTAFYYSKTKLGYLVSAAVDEHGLEPIDGIELVRAFLGATGKRLAFLHVSGLEWAGSDSGWLSPEYLDELKSIDAALAPLLDEVRRHPSYAIVVTSDHAGHGKSHGTQHPDDYKLPLIMDGSAPVLPSLPKGAWPVTELRALVQELSQ